MEDTKACKVCGLTKPLCEFHKSASCLGGYNTRCKVCFNKSRKEYGAKYRGDHRERRRLQSALWYEAHKEYVKDYTAEYYYQHRKEMMLAVKKWRRENPDKARVIDHKRYLKRRNDPAYIEIRRRADREHAKTPQAQAKRAVWNAVRSGVLARKPCAVCGTTEKVEAHHHLGYDAVNWLNVRWLCHEHHIGEHGKKPFENHGDARF